MRSKKINIFDIANEAGVSIATVSRALSDAPNPNSAKQRKVLEVVQKYNYKPSVAARGLNQGHSKLISIGLPEIAHPFYSELFSAAADEARANGYSLILSRIPDNISGYQAFLDQLIERRPDGVILAGGMVEDDKEKDRLTVLNHLRNYMPIVLIGDPLENFPCVCISGDMQESAAITVRHLHALGHKRIAFLGGKLQKRGSSKREQGYHAEMLKLGLEENICVRLESGYSLEDGAIGIQKLLTEFTPDKRPTAVIAINDLVAMGILRQLDSQGIRVPDDIAVVGCDNQFFTSYTNPPLTTIDLHISELGRRAMIHLLHWEKGQSFYHLIKTNLIVRESCGVKLGRRKLS
ncbi:MAG TPA: LacI family DNA-binding transcriptional regulator [Candidatus Limiplasma sp.]|nr:LacI family DNA-binding transcriptional regulator [Candidatus Limiplasma sp.]